MLTNCGKLNVKEELHLRNLKVSKRKKRFAPLTQRLTYRKLRENKAMRYGNQNESKARNDYTEYIQSNSPCATVQKPGIHIPCQYPWLGASPDGLVYDPSCGDPNGLLEVKCPLRAKNMSLLELCTKKEHKPATMLLKYC